ncbi:unnamed protein product [Dovyalis caffra]|uniref:Uncharacterized protein n=1 Tax=Dovyalis caffra TaxID=77055 RepID=A0AAV1SF25_9ROSI|nr:unnamed protein product [Dovyalis caffra]
MHPPTTYTVTDAHWDTTKSMIDGGMVRSLAGILQVIDLDHPDAPKIVNLLLKALVLWKAQSRAANASEQSIIESIGGTHEVPDEEEADIRQRRGTPHVERSRACTSKSIDRAKHEDRIGRYNGNQPINGDRNGFHA